jgi:competence protein ComEA
MKYTILALTLASSLFVAPGAYAVSVDINTADAETIADALNGVGIVTANSIVDYRTQNGPFESAEELMDVKGIGEKTLEKIEADVLLD